MPEKIELIPANPARGADALAEYMHQKYGEPFVLYNDDLLMIIEPDLDLFSAFSNTIEPLDCISAALPLAPRRLINLYGIPERMSAKFESWMEIVMFRHPKGVLAPSILSATQFPWKDELTRNKLVGVRMINVTVYPSNHPHVLEIEQQQRMRLRKN